MDQQFFRPVAAGILIALTAGCQNLPRSIEPRPLFPPPDAAIEISGLPKNSANVECGPGAILMDGTRIPPEIAQFAAAMACAYKNSPSGADYNHWMIRFIDKGLALSDQSCEMFFDGLEARRVEAAYAQTNFNVGGTALTALLAAGGHHANAILYLATALTAGNAWFENYKSNYVMTPQLRKLHDKIQHELRDPIKQQVVEKSNSSQAGYRSFDEAKGDLLRYDALCSHKVITDVLSSAVDLIKLSPEGQGAAGNAAAEKAIAEVYQVAARPAGGGFAPGKFGANEFETLFVVATEPAADIAKAATALSKFPEPFPTYVSNLGLAGSTPNANALANIRFAGNLLKLEDKAVVKTQRANVRKQMAALPAAGGLPGAAALPVPPMPLTKSDLDDFNRALSTPQAASPGSAINFGYRVRASDGR